MDWVKSSGIVNIDSTMVSVWKNTWMKKPSGIVWRVLRGERLKMTHVGMMAKADIISRALRRWKACSWIAAV